MQADHYDQCDETKPSCLRCLNRHQPCEYVAQIHEYEVSQDKESRNPAVVVVDAAEEQDTFCSSIVTPPSSISSLPHTPALYDVSPGPINLSSDEAFAIDYTTLLAPTITRTPLDRTEDITQTITKDLFLFDHYMTHTCHDMEVIPIVSFVKSRGLPQLAAENQGILCSIMALGAACLCIDLLLGQSPSNHVEDLSDLISAGDRYHKIGMQSAQTQMTSTRAKDLAEAHAHAILLLPYAMARRRISILLSDAGPPSPSSGSYAQAEHLSTMEWTIVLRGITTTSRACWPDDSFYLGDLMMPETMNRIPKPHPAIASHILAKLPEPHERRASNPSFGDFQCLIASEHPLFPVISATRLKAFDALQKKVDRTTLWVRERHRTALDTAGTVSVETTNLRLGQSLSLTACSMAVDLLVHLSNSIFNPDSDEATRRPSTVTSFPGSHLEDFPIPWLREYTRHPVYDPKLPAIRSVFSWVNQTPDAYFQLLLQPVPLRNDYLHTMGQSDLQGMEIDREIRMLAWDIWAHWLVLTILIEGESFFTAGLGVSDINNLSPHFHTSTTPSMPHTPASGSNPGSPMSQSHDWWPGNMCSVAQQLRRYQSESSV